MQTGLYLGQCAQYCGTQHAKMLLRVYVQSREDFDRWIEEQRQPAAVGDAVTKGNEYSKPPPASTATPLRERWPTGVSAQILLT
jgi:heme/copper-type cytochrome/quinol oxidase subunit 2